MHSDTDVVEALAGILGCNHGDVFSRFMRVYHMEQCFCSKPEDRLYHHEDNTWWRRDEQGRLVTADPPEGWTYTGKPR